MPFAILLCHKLPIVLQSILIYRFQLIICTIFPSFSNFYTQGELLTGSNIYTSYVCKPPFNYINVKRHSIKRVCPWRFPFGSDDNVLCSVLRLIIDFSPLIANALPSPICIKSCTYYISHVYKNSRVRMYILRTHRHTCIVRAFM